MKIIGFHWNHHSSVALLDGTEVRACVAEERFTGRKNDSRFPERAAAFCAEAAGGPDAIDAVAIATVAREYDVFLLNQISSFGMADFIREQNQFWKPWFYEGRRDLKMRNLFPEYVDRNQYPKGYWSVLGRDEQRDVSFSSDIDQIVAEHFRLSVDKVKRIDHHWCHARYALHASEFHDGPTLVLTVDGKGDGANATIFLNDGGKMEGLYRTPDCTLGRYYRHITLMLGMRPLEHEYKLMGLAPYASGRDVKRVADILQETLTVDGITFVPGPDKPRDSYFAFRELFEGIRFDHIAAGLQLWVEQTLEQWVRNVVRHFGVDTVVVGGGVAMNVKAMGRIGRLPEIRRFFVPGSSSDESNAIGAALCLSAERGLVPKKAVTTLYLGPEADGAADVCGKAESDGHVIIKNPSSAQIVELLLDGMIIGRCVGRMEFGQRALGNRSILADPIDPEVVPRINAAIKSRDFWMPFAPVVLDTVADTYLLNPNHIDSPHMTIAFQTTDEGFRCLRAACHSADRTARAQILKRRDSPALYELLEEFRRRTGRGGLLNTSFNLHGSPIVRDAFEAYEVFHQTKLDALLIPNALIVKPQSFRDRQKKDC